MARQPPTAVQSRFNRNPCQVANCIMGCEYMQNDAWGLPNQTSQGLRVALVTRLATFGPMLCDLLVPISQELGIRECPWTRVCIQIVGDLI